MSQLNEVYRPKDWSELVGQDKAVGKLRALTKRGFGGRAYWISGSSGTGKTTIARLIAREVAHPCALEEIDACDLTSAKMDDMLRAMQSRTVFQPSGRAWIVNEAHGLNAPRIRRLLSLLEPNGEPLPDFVTMIFTTTNDGEDKLFADYDDASPLLSRCFVVNLARRDLCKPFAELVVRNCRAAGLLNGKPDSHYIARAERFLKTEKNNCRALYQATEAGYLTDADNDQLE